MTPELFVLSPLPPFLAAIFIGCGMLAGGIHGESGERLTRRVALGCATVSLLLVLAALYCRAYGEMEEHVVLGTWLKSGNYRIDLDFTLDPPGLALAALSALLGVMVLRFSVNYLHREAGFHRFFLVLSLFLGAMLLLSTAGNAALTFIGWELAGVCSYLLIAYNYERPAACANATRAFVTNRIGDGGFVLGIALAFLWTSRIGWADINDGQARLEEWQAGILACCFLLAAAAKSAQVPLTPWLARAVEGPTPSSALFYGAVMVHAGVFLVLRLEPLFEQAPLAMDLMAGIGLLTALYGFLCGLAQTDVKSALVFATTGQVGLMFFTAGLGGWGLALFHLCAHGLFRGYQFLAAPSLMHQIADAPARPVHPLPARSRRLYVAVLNRFWLENLGDWLVTKPVSGLAHDLHTFERQIVEPAFGLPATAEDASQIQDRRKGWDRRGVNPSPAPEILRVSGLPGWLLRSLANALHWFEEKLVLQGAGGKLTVLGRKLGHTLNHVEGLLNQPRYLALIIFATLLAVF